MRKSFWSKGDAVVLRSRPQGQVGYVIPMRVVVDGPDVTRSFRRRDQFARSVPADAAAQEVETCC